MTQIPLHRHTGFAVLILGLLGPVSGHSANLIPDPSFEAGAAKWNLGGPTTSFVSAPTRTGSKALKMDCDGNGVDSPGHNVSQNDIGSVAEGDEFEYRVYANGAGVTGAAGGDQPLAIISWSDAAQKTILAYDGRNKESYLWAPMGAYGFTPVTMAVPAAAWSGMMYR